MAEIFKYLKVEKLKEYFELGQSESLGGSIKNLVINNQ
jgi:hypothetical protein